jgi:hypothetical protein
MAQLALQPCHWQVAFRLFSIHITCNMQLDESDEDVESFLSILKSLELYAQPSPHYVPHLHSFDEAYWKRCSLMGDDQFKRHFRITRTNFLQLHSEIFEGAHFRTDKFPTDFMLGVFLYRMATKQSCRELGELFSISQSSVTRVTSQVASLIHRRLTDKYIRVPTTRAAMFRIAEGFERLNGSGFPGVIGVVDGTRIVLDRQPAVDGRAYFDRKKNYSIAMQGVVDSAGIFLDIDIGWPGSVNDARIWRNSKYLEFMTEFLADMHAQYPTDRWIVLGDAAYPLSTWLMKPYPVENEQERVTFNIALAKARVAVEQAFGRLKQRWRRLKLLDAASVESGVLWIHACTVLHNFCEMRGDVLEREELERVEEILARDMHDRAGQEVEEIGILTEDESRHRVRNRIAHELSLRRQERQAKRQRR